MNLRMFPRMPTLFRSIKDCPAPSETCGFLQVIHTFHPLKTFRFSRMSRKMEHFPSSSVNSRVGRNSNVPTGNVTRVGMYACGCRRISDATAGSRPEGAATPVGNGTFLKVLRNEVGVGTTVGKCGLFISRTGPVGEKN